MNYVYCAHRKYSLNVFKKLKKKYKNFILVNGKDNLTLSKIKKINPQFIFNRYSTVQVYDASPNLHVTSSHEFCPQQHTRNWFVRM